MLIDQNKHRWKYIFKGLLTIFLYFFITYIRNIPFILLNINLDDISKTSYRIYLLILDVFMLLIMYLIYEKEFSKAIDDLKNNHNKYFKENLKYYIIGIIIMVGANVLINFLGGGISSNENSVRNELFEYPISTYISAVLLAPIIEETVFRLSFNAIFKNKIIFILTSGLFFGYLHVITMPVNKLFPIYLISYAAPGLAFAYINKRTNNILVSTVLHLMHNGILVSMQIFLFLFT